MRIFLTLGGLLAATSFAWGADLPVAPATPMPPATYAPPAPVYNWTGFYIGLNAGYGIATASATATVPGASVTASENLDGFIGGGQVGINYQAGMAVFGIEADFDGSAQSNTTTGLGFSETDKIPWVGTVRGRIGAAFDRFLVYGTGGVGWGEFESTANVPGFGSASASQTHIVYVAGAGVEYGLTPNLTARVEYLYLDTGNLNVVSIGAVALTDRVQDSLVRAGVNYKF